MKTFKVLFLSLVLTSASASLFAGNVTTPQTVSQQIRTLLTSTDMGIDFDTELTFKISFIVNSNSEIVVLSTNNRDLDDSVKSALNYKKVAIEDLEFNKVYTLPISLKKY